MKNPCFLSAQHRAAWGLASWHPKHPDRERPHLSGQFRSGGNLVFPCWIVQRLIFRRLIRPHSIRQHAVDLSLVARHWVDQSPASPKGAVLVCCSLSWCDPR